MKPESHTHAYKRTRVPIVADNPKFDRSKQLYFIKDVCECGKEIVIRMEEEK